ncbi:MAG: methyltransferase domain-containing protein [Candidatus Brocadiales bacterium]
MSGVTEIGAGTVLYRPEYRRLDNGRNGNHVLIDPEGPNWIGTDIRGEEILGFYDGRSTFGEVVRRYSASHADLEPSNAWLHVHSFTRDALRSGFLSAGPFERSPYRGRDAYLKLDKLNALWIHTNDSCNLSCAHCLVDSSPSGDSGLPAGKIIGVIDEARRLGTTQFYLTGGEPLLRQDFFELVEHILSIDGSSVTVLTNGTLLDDGRLLRLQGFPASRFHLQVSLDGSNPDVNDPVRGKGSFYRIVDGIKQSVDSGISVTVSTVITSRNVEDVWLTTKLLPSLGARNHHLLFMHHRGRSLEGQTEGQASFEPVPVPRLVEAVSRARQAGLDNGVTVDNLSFLRMRVDSPRYTKHDLSNACWDSLCLYSDGHIYPSAALAGYRDLSCGQVDADVTTLEEIWKGSDVCRDFRRASLPNKQVCDKCEIRFICGGGDIEHSYLYSSTAGRHNEDNKGNNEGRLPHLLSMDPYCGLYKTMIPEMMHDLVEKASGNVNRESGFNAPGVLRGMGEGAASSACGAGEGLDVRTLSSNCVLSAAEDTPRRAVREFYADAATEPQEELCCADTLSATDVAHIPAGVLERAYGCGSPVTLAGIRRGENVLDLGSGAGIDCFITAKKVGPDGLVIGVDMTDEMLDAARGFKTEVARSLGYDVVDFRKGFLEEIPADAGSIDVILSNCVINLSPDKKQVFGEMWRVLKDHGRIVVSDIVSDQEVPDRLRADKELWGQCLSGALTEEEFLAFLEQAGFYGTEIISKSFWKEVEGYRFFSVNVRGYKYKKSSGCTYSGHRAVYLGPQKAVIDEEGHLFPRGEEVEVCTDTANKLRRPPYSGSFVVIEPSGETDVNLGCGTDSDEGGKCCG